MGYINFVVKFTGYMSEFLSKYCPIISEFPLFFYLSEFDVLFFKCLLYCMSQCLDKYLFCYMWSSPTYMNKLCDWLIITMKHNKTAVLSSLQRKYDRNDNKQAERCDCVFTMSSIQRKIKRKQKQQHKRKERIRSQYVSSLTLML